MFNDNTKKTTLIATLVFLVLMPILSFGGTLGLAGQSGKKELEEGIIAYEIQDYRTAAANFLAAAEKGNDEAQYYIGLCYHDGKGVQKDLNKALQWLKKSAEKNNENALYQLGEWYLNGDGVRKDTDEALKWYRKSADKGGAKAMSKLGMFYYEGKLLEKDIKEAVRLWKKASDKGNDYAMSRLAYCLFNGIGIEKNISEAIRLCRKTLENSARNYSVEKQLNKYVELQKALEAANNGDVNAIMKLAYAYEDGETGPINDFNLGKGVEKDLKESAKWYHLAADKGDAEAMKRLGKFYVLGYGVEIDTNAAIKWYRKALDNGVTYDRNEIEKKIDALTKYTKAVEASNKGDAAAMCEIGDNFLNKEFGWIKSLSSGPDCEKEALEWYRKAADKGSGEAMFKIGKCRYNVSDKEAFEWFQKSAEKGYPDAIRKIADSYLNGKGVEADLKEAAKWYRLIPEDKEVKEILECLGDIDMISDATEQGDAEMMYETAKKYYALGNRSQAINWYEKAAENGHVKAMFWLGDYYRSNLTGDRWYNKAVEAATKVAAQGDADAMFMLAEYYEMRNSFLSEKWYADAADAFSKKAEQGDAKAQFMMGKFYNNGKGVKQSNTEALKWYRKAADQDYTDAQYNIGAMYYNGDYSFPKNDVEAYLWFSKAAAHGDKGAIEMLKRERMVDVGKTYSGAENGDAKSQYELGVKYYRMKDYKEAVKWFQMAADKGNAEAMNKLGECYHNGYGVEKKDEEGTKWDRKAVEKIFEENEKGSIDILVMFRFLDDFARQGNKEAKRVLDNAMNN